MNNAIIRILIPSILFFSFPFINAQEVAIDSTRHQAQIKELTNGKAVTFNPELTPLRQIAGAPQTYWTYYWEFDDGNYSFEKTPKHKYKEPGTYNVRLSATNNYDDGKPPLTRPKRIDVSDTSSADSGIEDDQTDYTVTPKKGFKIQNNREPSPNEEMQLILSYNNEKNYTTNGKLYLFYNDAKFKDKNFELVDIRSYHDEEEVEESDVSINYTHINRISGMQHFTRPNFIEKDTTSQDLLKSLDIAKKAYYDLKVWNVNDLEPNEERNLFFTLKTTPEMLKDTSAILTIRSIYVPERGSPSHKITEKEMEIVTSHDPNKMAVYNSFLNYRLVRFKRLKYKVRFQNDGEGPARLIKLNTDIPKMLDRTSLKIIDTYPKVPMCPDGKEVRYSCIDTVFYDDKVSFQFKNIYLPGTNQKGVYEKDSTKGFVKYSMKFGKNFHKQRSKSRTAIIFDKNEPIITNSSTSRFKPGISIGAKAGYNYFFTSDEDLNFNEAAQTNGFDTTASGFFAGVTISPYKSYRWYLQAEVMASVQHITTRNTTETFEDISPIGIPTISQTQNKYEIQKNYVDIVPVSLRYNVNSIIGLGVGPQFSVNFWQKSRHDTTTRVFVNQNNLPGKELHDLSSENCEITYNKELEINNYGIFADITLGVSRIGPSIGIRYVQNFNEPTKQLHTYAIWKF